MNLINEGIQATHNETGQLRQSQTTQTSFFETESVPEYPENISLIGTPKSDFAEAISRIDPSVLASVSRSLQLTSSSEIVEFAETLNDAQYQFLLRLLSPFDSKSNIKTMPTSLSTEQISFFDLGFRFQSPDFKGSVISGPFFVGSQPQHFSQLIAIKKHQPNQKIIFQSISSMGPAFPPSLTMWYGEMLLYSPNFTTNSKYIDLTPILNFKSSKPLEFTVQSESQWYCIVIRTLTKIPYSRLLNQVLQRKLPKDFQSSICCPLTGKIMKVPVRSIKCQHTQCFDLKSAIKRNNPGTSLLCPICGETIEFDDIAVNWEIMNSVATQRVNSAYSDMVDSEK